MKEMQNKISDENIVMNRKGFGMRAEVRAEVAQIYKSSVVEEMKKNNYILQSGVVTVYLAREFGFCYGVDRAVELAYETRKHHANKRIFLTTEIIHNPTVNGDLRQMGIEFLSGPYKSANSDDITDQDVVIVPAFGATIKELQTIHNKGCQLVDTICGSVVVVWKRVEKYAQEGFTAIIHGKHYHEETQATSSQVLRFPQGHYLIVLNKTEANLAIDYLNGRSKMSRDQFLDYFSEAISPGFDPDIHLQKVGLANQTTMLASESLEIADMFSRAIQEKYGLAELSERFRSFDTICSATQERQDAIEGLGNKSPDLMIVVGGYNSSNTAHLLKKASDFALS